MTEDKEQITMDIAVYLICLVSGAVLGFLHFGSLWVMVSRLGRVRRPVVLVFGRFLVMMAVTLVGLYLIMGGRWERLIAALAGFMLVKVIVARRVRGGARGTPGKVRFPWIP